jgi:hypothetical protein
MPKLPYIQFYVNDWLGCIELRASSPLARALWMDALCYMQNSPKRGYLMHPNGEPIVPEDLAQMTGFVKADVIRLLAEMKRKGVYSETPDGVIFCRRMVREEELSEIRRRAVGERYKNGANQHTKDPQNWYNDRTNSTTKRATKQVQIPGKPEARIQNPEVRTAAAAVEAKWPLAVAAITERFAAADEEICAQIAAAALEVYPDLEDYQLRDAIAMAHKRDQRSPAMFLKTVPTIIRNWRRSVDAVHKQQAERDAASAKILAEEDELDGPEES